MGVRPLTLVFLCGSVGSPVQSPIEKGEAAENAAAPQLRLGNTIEAFTAPYIHPLIDHGRALVLRDNVDLAATALVQHVVHADKMVDHVSLQAPGSVRPFERRHSAIGSGRQSAHGTVARSLARLLLGPQQWGGDTCEWCGNARTTCPTKRMIFSPTGITFCTTGVAFFVQWVLRLPDVVHKVTFTRSITFFSAICVACSGVLHWENGARMCSSVLK